MMQCDSKEKKKRLLEVYFLIIYYSLLGNI